VPRDDQHDGADGGQAHDRGLQREQHEVALREERPLRRDLEDDPDRRYDEKERRVAENILVEPARHGTSYTPAAMRSSRSSSSSARPSSPARAPLRSTSTRWQT